MVRRIRILVFISVWVSVAATGANNSVSANDESHSSLCLVGQRIREKKNRRKIGSRFKEQGADYFINFRHPGFDNLTPEALEIGRVADCKTRVLHSAQSYLEGVMSPYGKSVPTSP